MNPKIKALKAAFPHTIPILMGFLFLGLALSLIHILNIGKIPVRYISETFC